MNFGSPSDAAPNSHKLTGRSIVLLEILIGLSLAGMLLSLLFSFLTQSTKMEKKFESVHAEVLAHQRMQMRLQDLFMTLRISSSSPLYTQKFPKETTESLLLIFDQGIDPDPRFCGSVTGKLYLDEKENLCLVTWPIDTKTDTPPPWRKEILLSKVKSFNFEFLGEKKKPTDRGISPTLAWHRKWELERRDIPSQIRLTIQEEGDVWQKFAFFLPLPEPIPTYWERKP